MNKKTHWQPHWDVEATIAMTANWYKDADRGELAANVTRNQFFTRS